MINNDETKSLDLGCGKTTNNHFQTDIIYGIDLGFETEFIKKADLVIEPIPFENDYFDYVTAFDFIEHIPRIVYNPNRRLPFLDLMQEIHRVLKVGGVFLSSTPAYPAPEAFQDPTHVNIITENTFRYFDENVKWAHEFYGFKGNFKFLEQYWHGPHLRTFLQKID